MLFVVASGSTALAIATAALLYIRRARAASVSSLANLLAFVQDEVISQGELTVVLGRFSWQPPGEKALLKLSAKPIPLSAGLLGSLETALASYSGAEYAYYVGRAALLSLVAPALRPAYSLEVIAPASEKQIDRARPQPGVLITETPALYRGAVRPYVDALDPKSVAWIYKCLDLSKERAAHMEPHGTPPSAPPLTPLPLDVPRPLEGAPTPWDPTL
jgi:m7GpppX diphosphatase